MSAELKAALMAVEGYLEKAESTPGAIGEKFGRGPGGYMSFAQLRLVFEAASTLTSHHGATHDPV